MQRPSVAERFWPRVQKTEGCWNWLGSKTKGGYGHLQVNSEQVYAHRLAYELLIGEIPEGKELDHLCKNPGCVNPSHLEPVTHRENILRGDTVKTHCPRGHPLVEGNLYIYKGYRRCRTCHIEHQRLYHAQKKLRADDGAS